MCSWYIIAIDVGIKNLGICVFDLVKGQVVYWKNESLVPPGGKYIPMLNVQYVKDFIDRHKFYFEAAAQVIVERQMRCNMRIIEALLQSTFYDRCLIISAHSVKKQYDLSTNNYRGNKLKAVEFMTAFSQRNPTVFAEGVLQALDTRKKDDLADSFLLALYYLDTYSNQLQT